MPSAELRPLLASVLATLPALFIVSQVELADALADGAHVATSDHLGVSVCPARGAKCSRCWNYSEQVGTDAEHPELCERCQPVVRALPVADQVSA